MPDQTVSYARERLTGNPFANVVSVEIYPKEFDGMSLETVRTEAGAVKDRYQPGDIVEVTLRVPEQFFTEAYNRADWESAVRGDGGFAVGDLTEMWRYNLDPEVEIYDPDGQQVPLW